MVCPECLAWLVRSGRTSSLGTWAIDIFINVLDSDRAVVCQDVHARMSALPYATKRSSCHVRLNAPFQGPEHNTKQCMNSPVMVDAVLGQTELQTGCFATRDEHRDGVSHKVHNCASYKSTSSTLTEQCNSEHVSFSITRRTSTFFTCEHCCASHAFLREDGPQILKSIPRELCGNVKYHYRSCQRADWMGYFRSWRILASRVRCTSHHQGLSSLASPRKSMRISQGSLRWRLEKSEVRAHQMPRSCGVPGSLRTKIRGAPIKSVDGASMRSAEYFRFTGTAVSTYGSSH